MEPYLLSHIQTRRVRVSLQNDAFTCGGWRACLNTRLLLHSILDIQTVSILFSLHVNRPGTRVILSYSCCCFMQEALDISRYTDLDLHEFRVTFGPIIVRAIRDRAEEEVRMGAVWERQRLEAIQRRHAEDQERFNDYRSGRTNLARILQEVEEWMEARRSQGEGQ